MLSCTTVPSDRQGLNRRFFSIKFQNHGHCRDALILVYLKIVLLRFIFKILENPYWHFPFLLVLFTTFFLEIIKSLKNKWTSKNSSVLNFVVFPKRSIRLQAGAMRIGNDSVDEMLCCLKKHRNADAPKPLRPGKTVCVLLRLFSISKKWAIVKKLLNTSIIN